MDKKKVDEIKMNQIEPDQEILMIGWAGLEGSSIIACEKEEELLERFTRDFVERSKNYIKKYIEEIPFIKEEIPSKANVIYSKDVIRGGVFGELWEIGKTSSLGIEVYVNKIPIRQETIEICELYDLNPYELTSRGSLLIITDKANSLLMELKSIGINAAIIGRITRGNDKVVINGEYKRFLTPPKKDELYKICL